MFLTFLRLAQVLLFSPIFLSFSIYMNIICHLFLKQQLKPRNARKQKKIQLSSEAGVVKKSGGKR